MWAFPSLKTIGWMIVTASLVGIIAYAKGNLDGRDSERVKALKAAMEQIEQRSANNEAVRDLNMQQLCIDIGGLPDQCVFD